MYVGNTLTVELCICVDISWQCDPARDVNTTSSVQFSKLHMDWIV